MTTVKEARDALVAMEANDKQLQKRAAAFIAGVEDFCKEAGIDKKVLAPAIPGMTLGAAEE